MSSNSFAKKYCFNLRSQQSKQLLEKFKDRLPFIVELADKSDLPDLDKHKYLVPMDITIGQFISSLRKRMTVTEVTGIYLFVNNMLVPGSMTISQIYEKYKNADGFCYMVLAQENTFGK